MKFSFRKYGRTGPVLLALLTAACHRQPMPSTPASTAAQPPAPATERALPPVEKGVSETLAIARKKNISGVAYSLNLTIPAQKTEPIAAAVCAS